MQKYRPENDNFKTLFGEKARIVLSKTLERFTAEELGHLAFDMLFILRALVKYNELDLETLKSFSEKMLPAFAHANPIPVISRLKGTYMLFDSISRFLFKQKASDLL